MPESIAHFTLVRHLVSWIERESGWHKRAALLVALPELASSGSPPRVGGYVPDVFLKDEHSGIALIGEAKTAEDIEKQHSRDQYLAFMRFLAAYQEHLFLLAVPWSCVIQTRSLIAALQRRNQLQGVRTLVLDRL